MQQQILRRTKSEILKQQVTHFDSGEAASMHTVTFIQEGNSTSHTGQVKTFSKTFIGKVENSVAQSFAIVVITTREVWINVKKIWVKTSSSVEWHTVSIVFWTELTRFVLVHASSALVSIGTFLTQQLQR